MAEEIKEGERLVWQTNGKTFVAREHAADEDGMRFTIDVVTRKGLREVGAAISLIDAHSLSRAIRTPYRAPEDASEIFAIIASGARNDTRFARRKGKQA